MECKNKILDIIKCFCFNNYYVIYIFKNGKFIGKAYENDIILLFQKYGNITLEEVISKLN